MAKKARGLTNNPFAPQDAEGSTDNAAPLQERRRNSLVANAVKQELEASGVAELRLADLAPNPDNPASRTDATGDDSFESFVANIGEIGVLMPLMVQPADVFLAEHPQHAGAVGERPYVVLAGHRRRAACLKLGIERVPVVVPSDLAEGRADQIVIAENVHRTDLSPLQEAEAYQRIKDRTKMSQRALSAKLGVPQARISRRLTILELPTFLHPLIDAGEIDGDTCLTVAKILKEHPAAGDQLERARKGREYWSWDSVARQAVSEAQREEAVARAREVAEAEGVKVVLDPGSKWGYDHGKQQLRSKTAVDEARKAGTLVVVPGTGSVEPDALYYTNTKPGKAAAASDAEKQLAAERRGRKDATKARVAAVAKAATSKRFVKAAEPWREQALLAGYSIGAECAKRALKVCSEVGIGPTDVTDYWEWRPLIVGHPDRAAIASVIALMAQEEHTGGEHRTWGQVDAAWVAWLTEHGGLVSNEWETARLADIKPAAEVD